MRQPDLPERKRLLTAQAQVLGYWQIPEWRSRIELAFAWDDEDQLSFMEAIFPEHIAARGLEPPHPYMPDPEPEDVGRGEISLGNLTTGSPATISLADVQKNVLIAAAPGRGKSVIVSELMRQLIQLGIIVHAYDTRNEFPDILAPIFPAEKLQIVDPRRLKVNPWDGPDYLTPFEWAIDLLPRVLRDAFFWRDRTVEMYREVCIELFKDHERITPALFCDSYKDIIPKNKQYSSEFGSLQRFVTMLSTVETFQCSRGESAEDSEQVSRIYMMKNYAEDARLFLTTFETYRHFISREYQRNRSLSLVFIFDELASFFTRETLAKRQDSGESVYIQLLRRDRQCGLGAILADQCYSLLHDVVRENCQTKIILDTRGPSRRVIAIDMNLNKAKEEFIAALSWNQESPRAVVQFHDYPFPVLVNIPRIEKAPSPSMEDLEARMKLAAESMKWEPIKPTALPGAKAVPSPTVLSKDYEDILAVVSNHPYFSMEEHADAMDMPFATFSTRVKELEEDMKLLRKVEIHLGKQGRPIKLLVPTDAGYDHLDARKIKYTRLRGDGSIRHKFWQEKILQHERREGDIARVEFDEAGKRADVGIIRGNERTAYEVVIEGTLEKEISNLKKDLPHWDRIVFGVENEEVRDRLSRRIGHFLVENLFGEASERVEIRLLRDFLPERKREAKTAKRGRN